MSVGSIRKNFCHLDIQFLHAAKRARFLFVTSILLACPIKSRASVAFGRGSTRCSPLTTFRRYAISSRGKYDIIIQFQFMLSYCNDLLWNFGDMMWGIYQSLSHIFIMLS